MTNESSPLISRRAVLGGAAAAGAGLIAAPVAAVASLFADDHPSQSMLAASDTALADIPRDLLAGYTAAAAAQCPGLPWSVLAAIGAIESGHDPTAIGPPLDGSAGVAAIPATPQGTTWHGDPRWERAVGLMQFLPTTFRAYGVATTGSRPDPFHPVDAAHSAAAYLCANGAGDPSRLRDALFAYNRADWYVDQVLAQAAEYRAAVTAPPAAAGAIAPDYVAVALAQLGKPYRWGAAGPDAFDCSGLTRWSLAQVGVSVPRVSAAQARYVAAYGQAINVEAAAGVYGALVFRIGVGAINHMVVSLGDGRTVEAWRTGEPVQVKQLAGRRWTSAGLVPGLTYHATPAPGNAAGHSGSVAVAGAGSVAGTGGGTPTRTASGADPTAPVGTQPQTRPSDGAVVPPRDRSPALGRHPSRPDRLQSAVRADPGCQVDAIAGSSSTRKANKTAGAEGARFEGRAAGRAVAARSRWAGAVVPAEAVESVVDHRDHLAQLFAEITNTVSGVEVPRSAGRGLAIVAVVALVVMLGRLAVTRRALRPDRRIRLTVLPTETFDPSDEEVVRYAAQLSRIRRTVRGPGRAAQAVRLRLDSAGEGRCAYRIEGAPKAASILELAGYDEIELRPTETIGNAGLPASSGTAPPTDAEGLGAADGDADLGAAGDNGHPADEHYASREGDQPRRSEPDHG